jgi:mannose-6-phosphate isomerase
VLRLLGHPSPPEAIRGAFAYILTGGVVIVDAVDAVLNLLEARPTPADPAIAALAELGLSYPGDPGVLVSLLLNHVILEPGEALFLPAGNVHAYLGGLGFEVMAASDNVLRGGLTTKHIDIPLLLTTMDFSPLPVPRLIPDAPSRATRRWRPPVEEFQLEQIAISPGEPEVKLGQNGPVVVIVLEGRARVAASKGECVLTAGEALLIPAAEAPSTIAAEAGGGAPTRLSAFAVTIGEPAA